MKKQQLLMVAKVMSLVVILALLSSCEGSEGVPGPQGEQGPQGPQGPRGSDGADGQNGSNGQDGQDGQNGQDGQDGQDGADGAGSDYLFADFQNNVDPSWISQNTNDDGIDWTRYFSSFQSDEIDYAGEDEVVLQPDGDVLDNQFTEIFIDYTSETEVLFEFDAYISSEKNFDYMRWYINGTFINGISGISADPIHFTYALPAGSNRVAIRYSKDNIISAGLDIGAIDNVKISHMTNGRVTIEEPFIPEGVNLYSERDPNLSK